MKGDGDLISVPFSAEVGLALLKTYRDDPEAKVIHVIVGILIILVLLLLALDAESNKY
jgi:hypothetical protein